MIVRLVLTNDELKAAVRKWIDAGTAVGNRIPDEAQICFVVGDGDEAEAAVHYEEKTP